MLHSKFLSKLILEKLKCKAVKLVVQICVAVPPWFVFTFSRVTEAGVAPSLHATPADSRWSLWLEERVTQMSELMLLKSNTNSCMVTEQQLACIRRGDGWSLTEGCYEGGKDQQHGKAEGGVWWCGPCWFVLRVTEAQSILYKPLSCQITSEPLHSSFPSLLLLMRDSDKKIYTSWNISTQTFKYILMGRFPWPLQPLWT